MNRAQLTDLIQTTLRQPDRAAQTVLAMGFPREVLWTALALIAVVNVFTFQFLIASTGSQASFPSYFSMPLVLFMLLAGVMVIYVHTIYWAGLALSGKGELDDVLSLLVWLQMMRSAMQIAIVILTILVPGLAAFASIAAFLWGTWVLLTFMRAALNLSSLGHALIVLVVGIVGLLIGVGILLTIIGLVAQGAL